MSKCIRHSWEFWIMAMVLKYRGRKPYFTSLRAVVWGSLGWLQSSAMFCFIARAISNNINRYLNIRRIHIKSQDAGFFPKCEKIWHPPHLCSHIPTIIWIWVAAAFLRPGLPSTYNYIPNIKAKCESPFIIVIVPLYGLRQRNISLYPCLCQQ